jgi:hypothetical protein
MKIKLKIDKHEDRMKMVEALRNNGYTVTVQRDTAYMPTKTFLILELERSDRA